MIEALCQRLQIGIHDVGISMVNDLTGEEILYISLTKSKVVWTETKGSRVRPVAQDINENLEKLYKSHTEELEVNPDDKQIHKKKYSTEEFPV